MKNSQNIEQKAKAIYGKDSHVPVNNNRLYCPLQPTKGNTGKPMPKKLIPQGKVQAVPDAGSLGKGIEPKVLNEQNRACNKMSSVISSNRLKDNKVLLESNNKLSLGKPLTESKQIVIPVDKSNTVVSVANAKGGLDSSSCKDGKSAVAVGQNEQHPPKNLCKSIYNGSSEQNQILEDKVREKKKPFLKVQGNAGKLSDADFDQLLKEHSRVPIHREEELKELLSDIVRNTLIENIPKLLAEITTEFLNPANYQKIFKKAMEMAIYDLSKLIKNNCLANKEQLKKVLKVKKGQLDLWVKQKAIYVTKIGKSNYYRWIEVKDIVFRKTH